VAQPHSVPQTNTTAILEYIMAQQYHITAAARRLFFETGALLDAESVSDLLCHGALSIGETRAENWTVRIPYG
jgi:hypothetical protein